MQLSYTDQAPEALLGMMSEDFTKYVDTVIPQGAVKTGVLLTCDRTVGKVRNAAKLPTSAAEITKPGAMGITILDVTRELQADGTNNWPALRPTPVLRRGRLWLLAESDIARWTHPFVRYAAGSGGSSLGGFRADADTNTAAQLTHAVALTDALAGNLFLCEFTFC